jgi:hypothetical protein
LRLASLQNHWQDRAANRDEDTRSSSRPTAAAHASRFTLHASLLRCAQSLPSRTDVNNQHCSRPGPTRTLRTLARNIINPSHPPRARGRKGSKQSPRLRRRPHPQQHHTSLTSYTSHQISISRHRHRLSDSPCSRALCWDTLRTCRKTRTGLLDPPSAAVLESHASSPPRSFRSPSLDPNRPLLDLE